MGRIEMCSKRLPKVPHGHGQLRKEIRRDHHVVREARQDQKAQIQKKEKDEQFEAMRAKQVSKAKSKGNARVGRKIMMKVFLQSKNQEATEEFDNEEDLEDEKYFM